MNKKILSAAVAMALVAGISGTALAAEGSLADVPKDHWSYQAVDQLVKDGIIEGMPDGTYAGDGGQRNLVALVELNDLALCAGSQ